MIEGSTFVTEQSFYHKRWKFVTTKGTFEHKRSYTIQLISHSHDRPLIGRAVGRHRK